MYGLSKEDRKQMGLQGREHVEKNYNFDTFNQQWVDLMTEIYEQSGSWSTRINYNGISFKEVA